MQVSVKKKSSAELNYTDVDISLPELVKREAVVATPKVERVVEKPKPTQPVEVTETTREEVIKRPATKRPSILNLGDLLSGDGVVVTSEVAKPTTGVVNEAQDPAVAEKLMGAKGRIMEHLSQWRPRFVAVFEPMTIADNVINISVPTSDLKEEILRSKTELLTKVMELSGVRSAVELNIEIREESKGVRPIKLEDRIAHMMELNPMLEDLKIALDLDVEG